MNYSSVTPTLCPSGNVSISNLLYLSTPELDGELHRLFCMHNSEVDAKTIQRPIARRSLFNVKETFDNELNQIMLEFKQNGTDFEYCPQEDDCLNVYRTPIRTAPISSGIFNRSKPKRRGKPAKSSTKFCVFCKNNERPPEIYLGHIFRNENDIVVCPYLRMYVCPICNATGDNAHTRKYCPKSGSSWSRSGSSSSESSPL